MGNMRKHQNFGILSVQDIDSFDVIDYLVHCPFERVPPFLNKMKNPPETRRVQKVHKKTLPAPLVEFWHYAT
ncbi:hypothetical protein Elgi_74900 [Paenibacillus elgii]|nr:hypothetical protein Elgi_74900 [Paenibacillus elgii]